MIHPLRKLLQEQVADLQGQPVTVMLSGGIDSNSILLLLRDVGAAITACSFTLEGWCSSDYVCARRNARLLSLPFVSVILDSSTTAMLRDLHVLIQRYGLRSKTAIECCWPFLHAIPAQSNTTVLIGHGADRHFGISKRAMIHDRHSVETLDAYRRMRFANTLQVDTLNEMGCPSSIVVRGPYLGQEIIDYFMGTTWASINKPKEKQPIYDAFPELKRLSLLGQHTNLQLGDSRIAARFQTLAKEQGYRSPLGLYNAIARKKP